ncbi:MAG: hypothetical protein ACM3VT_15775, partial [Solirubrobacterales bacterium]
MLSVRIDGREVETTPISLARLVLDGRVDRHSPAKTPGTTAERSLEQSLESPHCEALSDELLHRLRSMYAAQSPEVDIQGLCDQVERLCQWHWANPHIAARFFWAAAWLNDVMSRLENAAEFYDAFLQTSSREGHLRLLAYNNRGIARIRLGRLEGVVDLARAAIPESPREVASQPPGLPVACFNLLNLINVSLESPSLMRVVDEELTDYFLRLSADCRMSWLGDETLEPNDECAAVSESVADSGASAVILRDPTCRRLNILTSRLAARASEILGNGFSSTAGRLSTAASQLALWESRSNGADSSDGGDAGLSDAGRYGFCAEAAGLLLSEDIPSSLTRLESPLARAEQSAREELASIEACLTVHRYELARSRLEVQRRILSSLNRRGRLGGLLARVDAQLERVAYLESQSEQLDLQKACAELISAVERFCTLTDLCRAQQEHDDLLARLRRVQAGLEPQTGGEAASLLDELAARLERHMHRLKRLEIRRGIRGPMRFLRRNWPQDWAVPVPETVYQALAQCQLNDPQGWVEDWIAFKDRLDGHQGQHHLHKAIVVLQGEQVSWDAVKEDLARAIVCKPDLWLAASPLFGLFSSPRGNDSAESIAMIQTAMYAAAARLFDAASQAAGQDGPTRRAGELLEQVFQQMQGRPDRCLRLWRFVAATLSPVLEREDIEAILRARNLAQRCLDSWPMGVTGLPGRVDPRNPVNLFIESCDKARRLVEAGLALNARPPQWDRAGTCYGDLLDLGVDTQEQLKRAVTGYYLAFCRQDDAPHV